MYRFQFQSLPKIRLIEEYPNILDLISIYLDSVRWLYCYILELLIYGHIHQMYEVFGKNFPRNFTTSSDLTVRVVFFGMTFQRFVSWYTVFGCLGNNFDWEELGVTPAVWRLLYFQETQKCMGMGNEPIHLRNYHRQERWLSCWAAQQTPNVVL